MKAFAVTVAGLGLLCNSMLAMAEGPAPLRSFMTTAGQPPSLSGLGPAQDTSAVPPKPTHHSHMTRGGKVLTGVGIGLLACGGFVIVGTAAFNSWETSSDKAGLYGGGIGLLAGGGALIVVGTHQRTAP